MVGSMLISSTISSSKEWSHSGKCGSRVVDVLSKNKGVLGQWLGTIGSWVSFVDGFWRTFDGHGYDDVWNRGYWSEVWLVNELLLWLENVTSRNNIAIDGLLFSVKASFCYHLNS